MGRGVIKNIHCLLNIHPYKGFCYINEINLSGTWVYYSINMFSSEIDMNDSKYLPEMKFQGWALKCSSLSV